CLEKREESLDAMRQAYEEAPDNPTVIFDYALILLKMEINLDEADRLLEAVEAQPLSDLLQMLLPFGHGLQQLNHKRYVEARDLLIESRRCLMPMAALPLVQMFLDFNAAYLAIASARCGDLPTALKFYRPAKKRLEAMGYTMLLARLNEALQGYV
ncbi:MAG: hypothetical protein KDA78_15255, partial [Planctomycetaceae bacterium]|nr:hypothetical protein [Planctomycetaceae bacterium]